MQEHPKNETKTEAIPSKLREVALAGMVEVGSCLRDLVIQGGLQVFHALLESEIEALCGQRYVHDAERTAYRHGKETVGITFGGRKVRVDKPRVRSRDGQEVHLEAWESLVGSEALSERVLVQILNGVTTRRYEATLEKMPTGVEVQGVSKSSVSRRFVQATKKQVDDFLRRDVEEDFRMIMLDGVHVGDHVVLTALGITSDGRKRILGCHIGSTENRAACHRLLTELIDRGLEVEVVRLFVIDGSKALRSAIKGIFGDFALIQRCQEHKKRNVLDHLPERDRAWAKTRFETAARHIDPAKGRRMLKKMAADLQQKHPGAARSITEGLDELFTAADLGATGWLFDTLRTTNPIENAFSVGRQVSKNVKRWRSGSMALRWTVSGLIQAEEQFRRIKGFGHLTPFLSSLDRRHPNPAIEVA